MDKDTQSFRNIPLSFRGSERQPPNVLQLGLRFSAIMERAGGTTSGSTESRLKKVIQSFNSSPGLNVKHQLGDEKEKAILHLICGSCKAGNIICMSCDLCVIVSTHKLLHCFSSGFQGCHVRAPDLHKMA